MELPLRSDLTPPSREPANASGLRSRQPQRYSLENRHSVGVANPIRRILAHPADDLVICRAHDWRPLRHGTTVRPQAMHDAALEPAFERLCVPPAARLGDAAGRHLHQAARLDQLFNLAGLMKKLFLTLGMSQDRPNPHFA